MLRASGGPCILKELSDEEIAVDIEDALRLNACGVGVQVFIGGPFETKTIHNMTQLVDAGYRYGMPVLGVTAVGKELARDARYLRPRHPDPRRARRAGRQDLLLRATTSRQVTAGCPVPDRHGRRQEAARARRAHDGLQRRPAGRRGRGHGPQHLPVATPRWP